MRASRNRAWQKTLYSLYLSLVMANTIIVASSHSDAPNKNPDTRALLSAIIEQVKISDTLKGNFEQRKYIHILPQPLLSSGVFQLDNKTGLVWQINKPLATRIVFNDTGIHQSKNGQAVWTISNERPGVAMIGQLMRAALSYDWSLLEKHFSIDGSINSSINDAIAAQTNTQQWTLTLTPKENTLQQTIKHIALAGGRQLTSLILFEANNDRTEITFDML